MKSINFIITENEIIDVAKDLGVVNLSNEKVVLILNAVEGDEVLWKDINDSISSAIKESTS